MKFGHKKLLTISNKLFRSFSISYYIFRAIFVVLHCGDGWGFSVSPSPPEMADPNEVYRKQLVRARLSDSDGA